MQPVRYRPVRNLVANAMGERPAAPWRIVADLAVSAGGSRAKPKPAFVGRLFADHGPEPLFKRKDAGVRREPQMCRIGAVVPTAFVEDVQAFWYRPVSKLIRDPVGTQDAAALAARSNRAVALANLPTKPRPAFVRTSPVNLGPKTLFERDANDGHGGVVSVVAMMEPLRGLSGQGRSRRCHATRPAPFVAFAPSNLKLTS
jgi:hypothetical protein